MSVRLKDLASINISGNAATATSATKASQDGNGNVITSTYATKTELGNKVDKVSGKQLSTEDFTTAFKNKLSVLFTKAEIESLIDSLQSQINTLVNSDADGAINKFNEIVAFLDNISDTDTLEGIIAGIESQISGVEAKIPTKVSQLTNDSGFTTNKGTVTSVTPGTGLTGTSSDTAITSTGTINLKSAGTGEIGGIKVAKDNQNYEVTGGTSSISANVTSGKYYGVEIDKNDKAFVYVPWTDTKYTHPSHTARTGKPTANATPGFGGSFTVSQITSDAYGHVTGATDRTVTIPSSTATKDAAGLMSAADKIALDGLVNTGGEVNQNAYSNVKVGDTTISAGSKTDTIELAAGSNVTLTPDATNKKVTINAKDTVYTHPNHPAKSSGLYKITVDGQGHVSATTAVAKSDITALGIPGSDTNTTYTFTGGTNKITVDPSNADAYDVTVTPSIANNVTYTGTLTDEQVAVFEGTSGQVKASGFTIGKSVPSNAVFTDNNTIPSAYCSTAAGTAAKAASCSGYVLTANTYLHLIVTTANTAQSALTLNVNGKGAKNLYINGSASSSSNYTLPAGSYIIFYDGTQYQLRTDGVLPGKILAAKNADTVNGLTVLTAVPANAKFTDNNTTYSAGKGLTLSSTTFNVGAGTGISVADDTVGLATSGVAEGTYGDDEATRTLTHSDVFDVPQFTVDAYGRITSASTKTLTLPASGNTDTKVTSVGNHYTPAEDTNAAISAASGTATNITGTSGKLNVVTGLKRDAKGHIVGVTSANIYSTDNNTTYSAITADELNTGTATTSRTVTAAVLAPWVKGQIDSKIAAADAMIYKGTIGSSGATVTELPSTTAKTGWTYKVATAGTYDSKACEVGDMIICLTDGSSSTAATWTVVQNNIDGAVTGPSSATDNAVAIFNGTTGKIIKDSKFTIGKSVPSNAVFTDTHYTTGIVAGGSGATANASATNPYVAVKDNSTYRSQIRLVGDGATTVSSDASGNITISSTDTNTWRSISDSVSSTSSDVSASSKAVKTAYDLAASKTSNTGTVTSVKVAASTGLSVDSTSAITSSGTRTLSLKSAATGEIGGIKVGTVSSSEITTKTEGTNYYPVNIDSTGKGYVALPTWSNNSGDITGVTAGNGLTGGGSSGSVTLNVGAGTGISVSADTVSLATVDNLTSGTYGPSADVTGTNGTTISVPQITVDSYGRVTSVANKTYTSKDTNTTYSITASTKSKATAATAGWYRIATSAAGISRCEGTFEIEGTVSGLHTAATVIAGTNYGVTESTSVTVLHCTQYSGTALTKARIVYHTTYNNNYAYLEVYNPNAKAVTINVKLINGFGWTLVDPSTAGSIPSGYSNKEVALNNGILGGHKHTGSATVSATQGGTVGSKSITPAGSVSSTFTGTAHDHSFTGTKHKHTFTGSSVTVPASSNTTTVYSIIAVGTLPSCTLPSVTVAYTDTTGELSITHNSGSFSAGTLPTKGSGVSVATGAHTHSVTAAGTIDEVTAGGTVGSKTAGGSVSSTFTGTAASHDHTFTGSSHSHTVSITTGAPSY